MTKLILKLALWWMFSKGERRLLRGVVRSVESDPGIPIYQDSGFDARHGVAVERAAVVLKDRGKRVRLGVELAYWVS